MWPRRLLGYGRMERRELVAPINQLYKELWGPLHNFFLPSMKLVKKWRVAVPGYVATMCRRRLTSASWSVVSSQRRRVRAYVSRTHHWIRSSWQPKWSGRLNPFCTLIRKAKTSDRSSHGRPKMGPRRTPQAARQGSLRAGLRRRYHL